MAKLGNQECNSKSHKFSCCIASIREFSRAKYWSELYWFLICSSCIPTATSSSDTTGKHGAGLVSQSLRAASRHSSGIWRHKCEGAWIWQVNNHLVFTLAYGSKLTCRLMVIVGKCLWTHSTIFSIKRITDNFSDCFVRTMAGQRLINISQSCRVTKGYSFGPSSTYSEPWKVWHHKLQCQ